MAKNVAVNNNNAVALPGVYNLPTTTYALRLVRRDTVRDCFVYYEAATWPDNSRSICDMYLRRAAICGRIGDGVESVYTVDILDEAGDIVLELPIERKAARYLVARLQLRVERDERG